MMMAMNDSLKLNSFLAHYSVDSDATNSEQENAEIDDGNDYDDVDYESGAFVDDDIDNQGRLLMEGKMLPK